MVLGLLIITSIPTVVGVAQAYSGQKEHGKRQKDAERMQKFHIDVYCDAQSSKVGEVHKHRLVLRNDRVYIGPPESLNPTNEGYVAEAFYIEYPDPERDPPILGLVSQTRADPPLLNWIYIDVNTMELRYGNKTQSIEHVVGPWDWTEDKEGISICGQEKFTAVEDPKTKTWQIFFDNDDDGLKRYVPKGRRKLGISLERSVMPGA